MVSCPSCAFCALCALFLGFVLLIAVYFWVMSQNLQEEWLDKGNKSWRWHLQITLCGKCAVVNFVLTRSRPRDLFKKFWELCWWHYALIAYSSTSCFFQECPPRNSNLICFMIFYVAPRWGTSVLFWTFRMVFFEEGKYLKQKNGVQGILIRWRDLNRHGTAGCLPRLTNLCHVLELGEILPVRMLHGSFHDVDSDDSET